MPQSFLDPSDISGDQFQLRGPEAHHVLRVLRCQPNDTLQLFDGRGQQFIGVVVEIDSRLNLIRGKILKHNNSQETRHYLRLFQGLPKGSKMDFIIEKAVELGADEVLPYLSQKSVIKLSPEQAEKKSERWTRLIKAAAKQSNRPTLPTVATPTSLLDLGAQLMHGFTLLFTQNSKSRPLGEVLRSSKSRLMESPRINMIVGPESGLSEKELDWLVGLGAQPVSLGNTTLRTETAGLAALAILRYELNLL